MMTTTTFQLNRGDERPFAFRDVDVPLQPPQTPSEWFARRYPAEAKRWGCPFLEAVSEDSTTGRKTISAVSANDCFLAATLSDSQLGHSVVFYEAEQQWFFLDPRDGLYHPTSEPKLMDLLSCLLVRCAEEMPVNIDKVNLFVKFRADDQLKAVIKKARSVLAADATFFSTASPFRRVEGPELTGQAARMFVSRAVEPKREGQMTVNDTYNAFRRFCTNNGLTAVERRQFKQLVVDVIREEFGIGLRHDLEDAGGRNQRGWTGVALKADDWSVAGGRN
ncbi:MAG: hypothetical protein EBS05_18655 [Proteobacteria bacterium]|nr:hypothetical protein [Pseudomonadota bacterium]